MHFIKKQIELIWLAMQTTKKYISLFAFHRRLELNTRCKLMSNLKTFKNVGNMVYEYSK